MGIQSTIDLSRNEAEEQLIKKLLESTYKRVVTAEVKQMSDSEIEDELDEHFYNYNIIYRN